MSPARSRFPRRLRRSVAWACAVPLWLWSLLALAVFGVANWARHNVAQAWWLLLVVVGVGALVWLLVRRRRARERAWLAAHADLAFIDRLTGATFETYIAQLLRRDGYRRVRVLGGAGDGGVDITGVASGGRPFAVQCKLYKNPVRPAAIREFHGVLNTTHRGYIGVFVASHGFTAAAREAATGLVLVGREELAYWANGQRPLTLEEG